MRIVVIPESFIFGVPENLKDLVLVGLPENATSVRLRIRHKAFAQVSFKLGDSIQHHVLRLSACKTKIILGHQIGFTKKSKSPYGRLSITESAVVV